MLASPHIATPQGLHARHGRRVHLARSVSDRAIVEKLEALRDAGVDIDKIPLSITVNDLMRMPIPANVERSQPDAREGSR
jgi:hypothetical protein